jgi:hypothetical protein
MAGHVTLAFFRQFEQLQEPRARLVEKVLHDRVAEFVIPLGALCLVGAS